MENLNIINKAEQALEIAVANAEINMPGILFDFDSIRDYVYTTYEDEYREWLEDKSGEEYSYDESWFDFAQEYLGYVYVDATEYGASQPYFVEGDSLKIEESNDEPITFEESKKEEIFDVSVNANDIGSNNTQNIDLGGLGDIGSLLGEEKEKKEELFNVNIDAGDIGSNNNTSLDLGGIGALAGLLASEVERDSEDKLEEDNTEENEQWLDKNFMRFRQFIARPEFEKIMAGIVTNGDMDKYNEMPVGEAMRIILNRIGIAKVEDFMNQLDEIDRGLAKAYAKQNKDKKEETIQGVADIANKIRNAKEQVGKADFNYDSFVSEIKQDTMRLSDRTEQETAATMLQDFCKDYKGRTADKDNQEIERESKEVKTETIQGSRYHCDDCETDFEESDIKERGEFNMPLCPNCGSSTIFDYGKDESKELKTEYYQMPEDEHIIWDSEDSIDDYDIDDMKEIYQDYVDNFNSEQQPMEFEEWLDSEDCANYFDFEWEEAAKENSRYEEWADFIIDYVDDDEKQEAYNEYVERCKNTTLTPDDFETWFDNYRIDNADGVWNWKEDDLKENIFPEIDKQLNDDILLLSGNYGSNYPDFKSSGEGGVMFEKGTEDFRQYMGNFDRVCITTQNGILGTICNDHDGTVSGQFYTLPDDKSELIKTMGYEDIIKERYDEEDLDKYNENDLMETEFNNDLYYGGIDAGDLNEHIDLLKPIKDTISGYAPTDPDKTKTESKDIKTESLSYGDLEDLAKDIYDWYDSDMGTHFDEVQGNEESVYGDIMTVLETKDQAQIQNFIDTIKEADISDDDAKATHIATTSSLIDRLSELLTEKKTEGLEPSDRIYLDPTLANRLDDETKLNFDKVDLYALRVSYHKVDELVETIFDNRDVEDIEGKLTTILSKADVTVENLPKVNTVNEAFNLAQVVRKQISEKLVEEFGYDALYENKEVKTEDVEYISQKELDDIPDDYKTTVGDTIRNSWEGKEKLTKLYKDLGYDEDDPMILARDDIKGTILKPVKVKKEEQEKKTEDIMAKDWLSQENKDEYSNGTIWAELDLNPDYIEVDYENEDNDEEWLDKVFRTMQTKATDYDVQITNINPTQNGYTVILKGTLQNIVDYIYDQKNYSIDKCIEDTDMMVAKRPIEERFLGPSDEVIADSKAKGLYTEDDNAGAKDEIKNDLGIEPGSDEEKQLDSIFDEQNELSEEGLATEFKVGDVVTDIVDNDTAVIEAGPDTYDSTEESHRGKYLLRFVDGVCKGDAYWYTKGRFELVKDEELIKDALETYNKNMKPEDNPLKKEAKYSDGYRDDLPQEYPEDIRNKYYEYVAGIDLIDDEPLDFITWVSKEYPDVYKEIEKDDNIKLENKTFKK